MLDGVSLDQLRTYIAAAHEGSFSAAGRRLRRAQSVVSQTLANLEGQLAVKLFDRSGHLPVLTDQGRALLANARAVACDIDLLKARAKSLAGGLEPELSAAIDVMFPVATFTAAGGRISEGVSRDAAQIRHRVECRDRARSRRALRHRHCGILGASATAAHSPKCCGQSGGAHGRFCRSTPLQLTAGGFQYRSSPNISRSHISIQAIWRWSYAGSTRESGACPILAPSWPSCARALGSVVCRCIRSRPTWRAARSLRSLPRMRRPGASPQKCGPFIGTTVRRGPRGVGSSTASSRSRRRR